VQQLVARRHALAVGRVGGAAVGRGGGAAVGRGGGAALRGRGSAGCGSGGASCSRRFGRSTPHSSCPADASLSPSPSLRLPFALPVRLSAPLPPPPFLLRPSSSAPCRVAVLPCCGVAVLPCCLAALLPCCLAALLAQARQAGAVSRGRRPGAAAGAGRAALGESGGAPGRGPLHRAGAAGLRGAGGAGEGLCMPAVASSADPVACCSGRLSSTRSTATAPHAEGSWSFGRGPARAGTGIGGTAT
jgi:hypothetical protein